MKAKVTHVRARYDINWTGFLMFESGNFSSSKKHTFLFRLEDVMDRFN
jgi:hypothetical protein